MAIEPLYSLDVAAELIPCTRAVLGHLLSKRASEFDPPRYQTMREPRKRNGVIVDYEGGVPLRMLTETECLKAREMIIVSTRKRERPPYAAPRNGKQGSLAKFRTNVANMTEASPDVWDILVNG